jgi:hypothetical protein
VDEHARECHIDMTKLLLTRSALMPRRVVSMKV